MKLIIDIDKQHFDLLQMAVMNGMGNNAEKIIAQGTPLEQIKAEIQKASRCSTEPHGLLDTEVVMDIIDKYI